MIIKHKSCNTEGTKLASSVAKVSVLVPVHHRKQLWLTHCHYSWTMWCQGVRARCLLELAAGCIMEEGEPVKVVLLKVLLGNSGLLQCFRLHAPRHSSGVPWWHWCALLQRLMMTRKSPDHWSGLHIPQISVEHLWDALGFKKKAHPQRPSLTVCTT